MSTLNFSKHTISDIPSATSSSSRPPSNIHGLTSVQFKDHTTPQTLEAAVDIKDARDVREDTQDLVGDSDELLISRVAFISFNI